ncbi:MAG: hypothetical protein HQ530_02910 [Parcubacteria group bacterium]|nr:hypothetical protein [Parcubacteria group bacterium]
MREQIEKAVQTALQGSRKVKITFKQEAIGDINYLLGMAQGNIVSLGSGVDALLMAIIQTHNWDNDQNRTLTITLTDTFDEDWFVGRMHPALESIEVAS